MKKITKLVIVVNVLRGDDCEPKYTDIVTGVSDGDTIEVTRSGEIYRVRLEGIDCPETNQAFGEEATRFVYDLCYGENVKMDVIGIDRYGRYLAKIILSDGSELNEELLRAGLAWHYKEYNNEERYAQLEKEARKAGIGLWSDANPIAPWDFRRGVGSVPDELKGKFVGSVNSDIYHLPHCQSALRINKANLVVFNTKTDAEQTGYNPCRLCNP